MLPIGCKSRGLNGPAQVALQEARRQRVEIALRKKPSTLLLGLVNHDI